MGLLSMPGEQLISTAIGFAGSIIDKIWPTPPTPEQRAALIGQIAPLLQDRDDALVNAQKEIIVAEMNQGDNYTKRARPSVVYFGLLFIGLVHVIFPIVAKTLLIAAIWINKSNVAAETAATKIMELTSISLPSEFWWAWSSVVAVWSIGRSAERAGATGKLVEMIVGSKR
jgi:hypothetical protein